MFNQQGEALKALMNGLREETEEERKAREQRNNEEQALLRELYDTLDEEDFEKECEYVELKKQVSEIEQVLNAYSIPKMRDGKMLSLTERLAFALREKMYA